MFQVAVLSLLTAILWGSSPVFEKAGLKNASPFAALTFRSLSIGLAMLCLLLVPYIRQELGGVTRREIAYFSASGLISGFAGQILYYYALKAGQQSVVVPVIAGLYPLVAVIWGMILFKEPITPPRVIGAVLIITGVIIIRLKV